MAVPALMKCRSERHKFSPVAMTFAGVVRRVNMAHQLDGNRGASGAAGRAVCELDAAFEPFRDRAWPKLRMNCVLTVIDAAGTPAGPIAAFSPAPWAAISRPVPGTGLRGVLDPE